RVAEGKGQAEQEAARHAEARVRSRMESQITPALRKANARYQERFRAPLIRRREFPEQLDISTLPDAIELVMLKANASQLGAPGKPSRELPKGDLAALAHESVANNIGAAIYAGRTLTRAEVERDKDKRRSKMPEEFQQLPPEENERDWDMTL